MTTIWHDRAAFLGRPWAHALILHLHDPEAWSAPDIDDLTAEEISLADRMQADHREPDGDVDSEFVELASLLDERTRAADRWVARHDAGDW